MGGFAVVKSEWTAVVDDNGKVNNRGKKARATPEALSCDRVFRVS